MKPTKYILITLITAVLLLSGCSTMQEYLYDEQVETVTVQEDTVMKADGTLMNARAYESLTGNHAPADKIIPTGTTIELVRYEPKKSVTGTIGIVESFVPYGSLIGSLAVLALGIGGGAAGTKIRKDGQIRQVEGELHGVIGGIEEFAKSPEGQRVIVGGRNFAKIKINEFATYLGVDQDLQKRVKKITTSGPNK